MNILRIIALSILLTSCNNNQKVSYKNNFKTYTVLVNYNSSYGVIMPSDTIIIESAIEPRMIIKDGFSVLKGSAWTEIYASNVRSFKILNIK